MQHHGQRRQNRHIPKPALSPKKLEVEDSHDAEPHSVYPVLLRPTTTLQSFVSTLSIVNDSTRSLGRSARRLSEGFLFNRPSQTSHHSGGGVTRVYSPTLSPDVSTAPNIDTDHGAESGNEDEMEIRGQDAIAQAMIASQVGLTGTGRSGAQHGRVVWSAWDSLADARVLIQVHENGGVSVWDMANLDEAREVLHLERSTFRGAKVIRCRAVPITRSSSKTSAELTLIMLLDDNSVAQYSLPSQKIVKSAQIDGPGHAVDIQVNQRFLAIAMTAPASLALYALHDLRPLPFSPLRDVSPPPNGIDTPVFALSSTRMLAYASTVSPLHESSGIVAAGGWEDQGAGGDALDKAARVPQPVSETARRLGEGMMSGMKAIGEYGYSRYRERTASSAQGMPTLPSHAHSFSRSAPQAPTPFLSRSPERWNSSPRRPSPSPTSSARAGSGNYLVVIDIVASMGQAASGTTRSSSANSHRSVSPASRNGGLKVTALFRPSRDHPLALVSFNPSGTSILTSSTEGHSFHIFELRPSPPADPADRRQGSSASSVDVPKVWHRYRLNRGLTVARATSAAWSEDSRFVAVSTQRGTSHVFAVHPSGGRATPASHCRPDVENPKALQPLSVSVSALTRIKTPNVHVGPDGRTLPVERESQGEEDDQSSLRPSVAPPLVHFLPSGAPTPRHPAHPASAASKRGVKAQTVSVLTFHPHLSTTLLTSIHLSASPPVAASSAPLSSRVTSQAVSGLTQMMRSGGASVPTLQGDSLLARTEGMAFWKLEREPDWGEVRLSLDADKLQTARRTTATSPIEIHTFSPYLSVLPRSIYLAPSFTFASYPPPSTAVLSLFNAGQFSPSPLTRITVRAEVAYNHDGEDDGPELHSAMHTILDASDARLLSSSEQDGSSPNARSPAFPNGYGRTSSGSAARWRDMAAALPIPRSIPIPIPSVNAAGSMAARGVRSLSGGIRSPLLQTGSSSRSPTVLARSGATSTSLAFEDDDAIFPASAVIEEDEEFGHDDAYDAGSGGSSSAPPLSSSHTHSHIASEESPYSSTADGDDPKLLTGEGEEDEWDAWKLDGIDDELSKPIKPQAPPPVPELRSLDSFESKRTLPVAPTAPSIISPAALQPKADDVESGFLSSSPVTNSLPVSSAAKRKKKSSKKNSSASPSPALMAVHNQSSDPSPSLI